MQTELGQGLFDRLQRSLTKRRVLDQVSFALLHDLPDVAELVSPRQGRVNRGLEPEFVCGLGQLRDLVREHHLVRGQILAKHQTTKSSSALGLLRDRQGHDALAVERCVDQDLGVRVIVGNPEHLFEVVANGHFEGDHNSS